MTSAKARVVAAQRAVDVAQASLVRSTAPLRESFQRHPAVWLTGAGFTAGFVSGLLPGRRWLQTGMYFASTGWRLLVPFLAAIEADSASEDIA